MANMSSLRGLGFHTGFHPTRHYCASVVEFSHRQFKKEEDVFWGFSGVLKQQASQFPQGFIWGLPYEALDTVLLWMEHSAPKKGSGFNKLHFPSWSWLSTTAFVTFLYGCDPNIIPKDQGRVA
ncbi:hypothetical protein F4804DRAFT_330758 [Jackrogersella minutella]|nr:hypothetical protein F4804DRAFT_330758 [Jackrogersella minutella]